MDHKAFVKSLPDTVTARLHTRQNRSGILHLLAHFGLIALLGTLIALRVPYWPVLLLPQGIILIFLFTLEHEATHKTPFARPALNEWAGRGVGLIILLPFERFRYFHLAHHRYTNVPGKDPELLAGAKPENWHAYLWHVSGLPYWGSMGRQIVANAAGRAQADYLPKSALPRIVRETRWMLVIYTLAGSSLIFSPMLFWVWVLPILLGQPFLRLYLLAEHGRCAFVANMFENTRTTLTTRLVRFVAWNMPYHTEHHMMPMVPYHQLPYLHEMARAHVQGCQNGYVAFTRTYVAAFAKDPEPKPSR